MARDFLIRRNRGASGSLALRIIASGALALLFASGLRAPTSKTSSNINVSGPDNAWLMTSTLLVLFMTLPEPALFYGGLVCQKNVLSDPNTMFRQRRPGRDSVVGDRLLAGFRARLACSWRNAVRLFARVSSTPNTDYSFWVSHNVFAMYQLNVRDHYARAHHRFRGGTDIIFGRARLVALWMFVVYFPLAHMIWGIDGWMNGGWNPMAKIRAIGVAAIHLRQKATTDSKALEDLTDGSVAKKKRRRCRRLLR